MEKLNITFQPEIIGEEKASGDNLLDNKLRISFPLLRTYPVINGNGDALEYERSKELFDTVELGYINLEHDKILNIGTIVDSEFADREDEEDYATINCEGVLWKTVLEEHGITADDIKRGKYQISMEVRYKDYYYMIGDERVEPHENSELEMIKGNTVNGKKVAKVIKPEEYAGAALTTNAADKALDIDEVSRAVAKDLQEKGLNQEQMQEVFNVDIEDLKVGESMLNQVRTPNYSGTETSPSWGEIDGLTTLNAWIDSYFEHSGDAPEERDDLANEWGELPQQARTWIANRSLLGDANADSWGEGLVLPVVNPNSDNLNLSGLRAARQRASQVSGITETLVNQVMNRTETLAEEEFDHEFEEGAENNMFKEFETEEDFNNFLEEEGYVKVNEVVAKFEELDLDEEPKELDEVVAKVKDIKEDYEELQEEIARKERIEKRRETLEENDIELEELEADEEDLAEMPEEAFAMLVKTANNIKEKTKKQVEEEIASEQGFDPTNINIDGDDGDEDIDDKDIVKNL